MKAKTTLKIAEVVSVALVHVSGFIGYCFANRKWLLLIAPIIIPLTVIAALYGIFDTIKKKFFPFRR